MNPQIKNIVSIIISITGMFIGRSLNTPFIFPLIFYVLGLINMFQLCQKAIKE